jgi:regulator of replication initiation timing
LDIENTLLEEVRNLSETVTKKDAEISYLIECDRKQIQENEEIQRDLKAHIRRLQDKIFVIQRESELELFSTVSRLHKQYEENIASMNADFDRIRVGHKDQVKDLKT